ncbi:MAG: TonB-dependent receptor plug domain-containing protein [Gemmatimonadales bacterium]
MYRRSPVTALILACAALIPAAPLQGQGESPDSTRAAIALDPITVTATRTPKPRFMTPAPVTVVDTGEIRRQQPDNAADLFRGLPGLDVTGVGTNQTRPAIRGQRGQRILLLEDGLRLNNTRRQQDFGEIPALVDVGDLHRIEIVRGPASVLYGTDAIGGVVNLITLGLPAPGAPNISGRLGWRYSTDDRQQRPTGELRGRFDRFAFRAGASWRETGSYDAPAGRFGDVTFAEKTRVHDTGVQDESYRAMLGYDLAPNQQVFVRGEWYHAENAGFGFVEPAPDEPLVQLRYPDQQVGRYSLGYRGHGLGIGIADRIEVTTYLSDNERFFTQNIFIPFESPPGAGVAVDAENFTDLETWGGRAEATRVVGGSTLLTYGVDVFRDRSTNTDSSTQTVVGFGPPQSTTSTTPLVPNASFRSAGAFIQADFHVTNRLSAVLGTRIQDIRTSTRPTPGLPDSSYSSHDFTVVGAANLLYRLTPHLNLIGAVGRGFRSPNIVERYFNGPAAEGNGFQERNPDLRPETSVNVDLGVKYRRGNLYLEGFVFRNDVHDGVRIEATGDSVGPFPSFRNVNVDRLRYTGAEFHGEFAFFNGFILSGNYTHLRSEDVENPDNPVGDTYSDRIVGAVRYHAPGGLFWAGGRVRHNGEQKEILLGESPIGPVLPAFTVLSVRGGVRLFTAGGVATSLNLAVENLTDELYAESANASFFRPEPGRSLLVGVTTEF